MDLDYRISCGFPDNWKIDALARKLGEECIRPLLRLWAYCRLWRADDGSLSGLSDQRIEEVSKWAGPPGAFVAALVQLGMLDGEPLSRTVHQWTLHQPWAASEGRRIEAARTAGRKSAETKGHTLDGASTLRQRSVNPPPLPSPPIRYLGGRPPEPPLVRPGGRTRRSRGRTRGDSRRHLGVLGMVEGAREGREVHPGPPSPGPRAARGGLRWDDDRPRDHRNHELEVPSRGERERAAVRGPRARLPLGLETGGVRRHGEGGRP